MFPNQRATDIYKNDVCFLHSPQGEFGRLTMISTICLRANEALGHSVIPLLCLLWQVMYEPKVLLDPSFPFLLDGEDPT